MKKESFIEKHDINGKPFHIFNINRLDLHPLHTVFLDFHQ